MTISSDPKQLLPDVMAKVASLDPASLDAVHRFLLRLELARLSEEIQDEAERLTGSGALAGDLIEKAVLEHRKRHPYAG